MSHAESVDQLARLPKELLVNIAIYCDALSALRLSTTCHAVRSACYDKLVFKEILVGSFGSEWEVPTERIEAAAQSLMPKQRCESVPSNLSSQAHTQTWARYALADYQASLLATGGFSVKSMKSTRTWLPALASLNHPILRYQSSLSYLCDLLSHSTGLTFSLAVAIIAAGSPLPVLTKHLEAHEASRLTQNSGSSKTYLWALCSAVSIVRARTARQRAAWPYGAMARLPHIQLPIIADIPFRNDIPPPLPFTQQSNWETWYQDHNRSLCTPDYFTSGTWCGYYTWFSNSMNALDPPMLDIDFEHFDSELNDDYSIKLRASGCRDGVGRFSIFAAAEPADPSKGRNRSTFTARKLYRHSTTWMWDLEITPFGLVGFWGHPEGGGEVGEDRLRRNGMVWLWKEEWTKDRAG